MFVPIFPLTALKIPRLALFRMEFQFEKECVFASVGVEMERPQTFPLEMKDKRSKGCALPSVCIKVAADRLPRLCSCQIICTGHCACKL